MHLEKGIELVVDIVLKNFQIIMDADILSFIISLSQLCPEKDEKDKENQNNTGKISEVGTKDKIGGVILERLHSVSGSSFKNRSCNMILEIKHNTENRKCQDNRGKHLFTRILKKGMHASKRP